MIETQCNRYGTQSDKAGLDSDNEYATKLHLAVMDNNLESIQKLIEGGAQIHSVDKFGRTPLHWALVFGYQQVAVTLIFNTSKRAIEYQDNYGCTPLHYAALGERTYEGRVLLERGALINSLDSKNRTPLHYAAQNEGPSMVEMLVSHGADKDCLDYRGFLPCDIALEWGSFSSLPCLRQDYQSNSSKIFSTEDLDHKVCPKDAVQIHREDERHVKEGEEHNMPKKGSPSSDKLMLAWKVIENNDKMKREASTKAIAKAAIVLEERLRQWREVEQETKQKKKDATYTLEGSRLIEGIPCIESSTAIETLDGQGLVGLVGQNLACVDHEEKMSNFETVISPQQLSDQQLVSPSPSSHCQSLCSYEQDSSSLSTSRCTCVGRILSINNTTYLLCSFSSRSDSRTFAVDHELGQALAPHKNDIVIIHDNDLFDALRTISTDLCRSNGIDHDFSLTTVTNVTSPHLPSKLRVADSQNRLSWKEENFSIPGAPVNGASEDDKLWWCTEWEAEVPNLKKSESTSESDHEGQSRSREVKGLGSSSMNEHDGVNSTPLKDIKGKSKALCEKKPVWVQVWPKPSSP